MKKSPVNSPTPPDERQPAYPKRIGHSAGLVRALAVLLVGVWVFGTGILGAAEVAERPRVAVVNGVVVPCRPVMEAVADAMQFLKKADGAYVPGRIDGDLAGYFTRAPVNADGSRSERQLAFPARQHAYFIFTFLRYHAHSGERQWLLRARDLADWNLAHSTPSAASYARFPYSVFSNGLYEATGDEQVKKKTLSGINALTYMQSPAGLLRTFFQLRHEKKLGAARPDWYSQHLYTVCHVLEVLQILPELRESRKQDTMLNSGP